MTDEHIIWTARRQKVRLFQDNNGEWFIRGQSGRGIPATDWEVSLWLELLEEKALRRLEAKR